MKGHKRKGFSTTPISLQLYCLAQRCSALQKGRAMMPSERKTSTFRDCDTPSSMPCAVRSCACMSYHTASPCAVSMW